jgi:hypothetical protein
MINRCGHWILDDALLKGIDIRVYCFATQSILRTRT